MLLKFSSAASIILSLLVPGSDGHGLIEDPPSRNWICGAVTKPHEVNNGDAQYPQCGTAFNFQREPGGYQFMSVLTHDVGRAGVSPLPTNVCGFDSETWSGGSTPWDAPMDWPTSPATPGRQEIKWNIFWGPHFSDTEEFRYWITKSDFVYDSTRALTWNDFESDPFCYLTYNDSVPTANPDVIPDTGSATFSTFCDVPNRSGHHIIYGEWGRNQWTYERFHGCIDLDFSGGGTPSGPFPSPPGPPGPAGGPTPSTPVPSPSPPVTADLALSPSVSSITGSGTITLIASGSSGSNLSYSWAFSTPSGDNSLYSISGSGATATLTYGDPTAERSLMIMLTVSNADGTSTESVTITHLPSTTSGSQWVDLGPLTDMSIVLDVGVQVSVRAVDSNGVDTYYPDPAFVAGTSNRWADNWPYYLSQAISASAPIAVGQLNTATDSVDGIWNATGAHIYARVGNNINAAYLHLADPAPAPTPAPAGGGGGTGGGGECSISYQAACNPWWCGLEVGFDTQTMTLDFTGSGLDLSTVTQFQGVSGAVQNGAFTVTRSGQTLLLQKEGWVSLGNRGYLGLNGNNVPALATFTLPTCI